MSAAKAVYRLIDIVVEEVSLVDRAANKHRFLIVKRDEGEGVDDDMEDLTQDADDEGEGTEGEQQQPPPQAGAAPAPAPLEVATKALASLTDAVERLSTSGASPEQVTALVAELDGAARELAKTLGTEPPARSEPGAGGDEPFASVRATLAQVREMIAAARPAPLAPPPEAPPVPATKSTSSAPAAEGKLDQLLEQVGVLAKGLKEQGQQFGQRVAQLEKQVGVANSTPAGERPGGREEEDGESFWSLDLNRPVDRESVDKSVSFHDV